MGYVKTPEEVAELEAYYAEPIFTYEGLSVQFETTREFVQSMLPPCLEPAATISGLVTTSCWQSRAAGEFGSSSIFINARYGDIEGWYTLTMLVTGDMPVTWGREIWGEVKKTGHIALFRDGPNRMGYGERNGVRIIEIDAELGSDEGPTEVDSFALEIKAFPSAQGVGLQYDPLLVVLREEAKYSSTATGVGTLTLRGTPWDPVDTIPVLGVGPIKYVTGEAVYRCIQVLPQTDREAYLPYVYGRHYDDFRLFPTPLRSKSSRSTVKSPETGNPVERTFSTR